MCNSDIDCQEAINIRADALKWWRSLPYEYQFINVIKNKDKIVGYPDRKLDTLTGREIEIMYRNSE